MAPTTLCRGRSADAGRKGGRLLNSAIAPAPSSAASQRIRGSRSSPLVMKMARCRLPSCPETVRPGSGTTMEAGSPRLPGRPTAPFLPPVRRTAASRSPNYPGTACGRIPVISHDVSQQSVPDQMVELPRHRPTLQEAETICRRSGARLTRLRRQVLAILIEAEGPLSAYELLDRLREERSATPAGVYRSLDFLLAHGLAHRLDSRKAFIACIQPDHPHISQFLICRRCGTAVEVEDDRISSVVGEWSRRLGFEVEGESLEVSGSCASCRTAPVAAATGEAAADR